MPEPTSGIVVAAYADLLAAHGFSADASQRAAIERLQRLADELAAPPAGFLSRLFGKPAAPPRSVYLWGGVGRGKSFVMDCFFEAVPAHAKRRVHFHAFMREVQAGLRAHRSESDPLSRVVQDLAGRTRLLCFDEFHVSDIADAMILGRLLESLLEAGVVFVLTSNYPPDGLYPGGLQRGRFVPTIDLLKARFDVLEVDSGTDYRLRALVEMDSFIVPDDEAAEQRLAADFERLAQIEPRPAEIEIQERRIPVKGWAHGVVWFDFETLCKGARSQNDYLDIAREHHTLVLSGIPQLGPEDAEAARRFTWLIDVLYEHRVKLIASAAVQAAQLYTRGTHANEFARTASRLMEMRGRDYLAAAHRSS